MHETDKGERRNSDVSPETTKEDTYRETMATNLDRQEPPPIPPIDPLVQPRDITIVVPRNLATLGMPANLPKFWGTKDEDPSRHMERYIERLSSSLITNPGYYLVWFPTTL